MNDRGRRINGHTHDDPGHDDPGAIVDDAVLAVEGDDFEAGQMAALAADFLTAGEGPEAITQYRLQEFLWYRMPRKTPPEDWEPLADGAARLLDKLGLFRYAEIARSETTGAVIAAWTSSDDEGFDRFLAEVDHSGLKPPDTELIAWGDIMGMEEAVAHDAVTVALEVATVAGEFAPGGPGWRSKAADVTRRALEEPIRPLVPKDLRRHRRLDLALGSRVEQWATAVHDEEHRERRARVAQRFLDGPAAVRPDAPPADILEAALAPMAWLLETCRDGVKATSSGYLEPALVREAAQRFDWWPFEKQPRSEIDVVELDIVHHIATRNRWVLRRSKRIRTSAPALALLADPVELWWAVTKTIGQADEFTSMVSELVALRLLEGSAEYLRRDGHASELARAVAEVMLQQGWRTGRLPISESSIEWAVHEPLREWRLFGLLESDWPKRDDERRPPMIGLSGSGRAAALAHLYARATEPRRLVLD